MSGKSTEYKKKPDSPQSVKYHSRTANWKAQKEGNVKEDKPSNTSW